MKIQAAARAGSVDQAEGEALADIFLRMGADAVRTHLSLEETSLLQATRFLRDAGKVGLDTTHPLVRALLPQRMVLKEQAVEASLEITARRSRTTSLSLQFLGRIVGAFAESRFASERTRYNRVEVVVVPCRIRGPSPKE